MSARQANSSVDKNISFFRDNQSEYSRNVQTLDTYFAIRTSVDRELSGTKKLLDIGNGGVFDYDVTRVPRIVALDLFLDEIDASSYPSHIEFKTGSALSIPERDDSFDGVIMVMLIHHLVGFTVEESLDNIRKAIHEACRVLAPGGKLIIAESCVPEWFYKVEKFIFPLVAPLINKVLKHPATLQYPADLIAHIVEGACPQTTVEKIPKGRWILQFGFKFPSILTPAQPYMITARKISA